MQSINGSEKESIFFRNCQSMLLVKTQDNNGMLDRMFHMTLLCWIYVPQFILKDTISYPLYQMFIHISIVHELKLPYVIQSFIIAI